MSEHVSFIGLGTIAEITMGQSPGSSSQNSDEQGLPFLQGCAEFEMRYPKPQQYCYPPLRIAKEGSILISVRAPVGKMNLSDQDYCIGRGLGAIMARLDAANCLFLKYALDHNMSFLNRWSQGTTFLAISKNDLYKFPVPKFPLLKQEKIAAILNSIDCSIERTELLIQKYQQIKSGLMHDLFTRGVTADGKLRPPREQAQEFYKETPIGWIPKDWNYSPVHELCSHIVDCPHSTPIYLESGIPCIRTADMLPGRLLLEQAYRVSYRTYLSRNQRIMPQLGDIIYSREGERLGIASPVGIDKVCMAQRVMLLRPKPTTDPDFLMWSMNLPSFYRRVIRGLGATTSPHVNVVDIKAMWTACPPEAEQKIIGNCLKRLQIKLLGEEAYLKKLMDQKRGLMQDLLTGKVQVKVDQVDPVNV